MDKFLLMAIVVLPLLAGLLVALRILFYQSKTLEQSDANEKLIANISLLFQGATVILVFYQLALIFQVQTESQTVTTRWFASGDFKIDISFLLDKFSLLLACIIALIGLLTLKFSKNYMHREAGFARFYMTMNLFIGAMLIIVLAGNAVLTFVGWELAGLCSYLLISYANQRKNASDNATKVIITNRIGDIAFLLAIFVSFHLLGKVEWTALASLKSPSNHLTISFIAFCFTVAAMVKSAQIPFTPWIERALEGPTPSSAIFYGSLMVHAGVYLLIRLYPMIQQSHLLVSFILIVSVLTVLYSWFCSLTQSDIKSALIFATITQVGLMFFWIGMGWIELAKWHLCLHAVWRAFQFLNAPSLIQLVGDNHNSVPAWLKKFKWLYTASMRRFWVEQLGNTMLARPSQKLSNELRAFDGKVVTPLVGLPSSAQALSSFEHWESDSKEKPYPEDHRVGQGEGVAGKIMQKIATAIHWFEESLVLKGGGENLIRFFTKLGKFFSKVDALFSKPRYLILMIVITLVIIL